MARVTPLLWKHKKTADGLFPIWIRVADGHRTLYHSTGEAVAAGHWNADAKRVRKSHPVADDLNALIQDRLAVAQAERVRLKRAGEPVTAEAIKAALVGAGPDRLAGDYLAYADRHVDALQARGQIREYRREKAVVATLRAFAKDALPFERITPRFLKEYETHLLVLGNVASTVNSNFRVIRTIFYAAIREGVVPQEKNPFLRFKLVRPGSPDRAKLTAGQVAAMEAVDLGGRGDGAPLVAKARDYFLFSFYAAGVRFSDVASMRRSDVVEVLADDGTPQTLVSYRMGKTGKPVTVRVSPAGADLVRAYFTRADGTEKGPGDFLFPMFEGYDVSTPERYVNASGSQNVLVNKQLKAVSKRVEAAGTPMPAKLTFHIARHTWADLARKSGRDVYEISRGMAHSGLGITERYLAKGGGSVVDGEI
ncbi:MAG TPA: site-specific integrase [Rubricoccaceae bacterium]